MNIKKLITTHIISAALIVFGLFAFISIDNLGTGLERQSNQIEQLKTTVIDTCGKEEIKTILLNILENGYDASFTLMQAINVISAFLIFIGILNIFLTKSLINKNKV